MDFPRFEKCVMVRSTADTNPQGCCRQTLDSLDAFVTQYQEVRKPDEVGGLATRRSWRQVLLKNYKTVMWTTEGGTIQSLRNMLAMHTQSISLTMQALQR